MGGNFKSTYNPPEIAPNIAPNITQNSNMVIPLPAPPESILYVICALISEERVAIEPSEKSNLPLPRLIERAKVVIMTIAVYETKLENNCESLKIIRPFAAHIIKMTTVNAKGIASVPAALLPISFAFCLLNMVLIPSSAIFYSRPPNEDGRAYT
jgi:hypothetical protein